MSAILLSRSSKMRVIMKLVLTLTRSYLSMETVYIFGGLGFIGHRLAQKIAVHSAVHVVDNALLDVASQHPELLRRQATLDELGVHVHHIDIFDKQSLSVILKKAAPTTVYHLAGASSVRDTYESEGFKEVLELTECLLGSLSNISVKRLVYFSSSMVYGDFNHSHINEEHPKAPVDRYGALKYASEILLNTWCRERNIYRVTLRPTAVYGEHDIKQRIVAKLISFAESGRPLTINDDGSACLDFTYIEDVVNAAVLAGQYRGVDDFNISYGQPRSLNDLADLIRCWFPKATVSHQFNPGHPVAKRGALNCDKAIRKLGYQPSVALEQGLSNMLGSIDEPVSLASMTPKMIIPLGKAEIISSDFSPLTQALQTGWYTAGPRNTEFEQLMLKFVYAQGQNGYALTVNSCASALSLALLAADIEGEVLVPAFTFSATVNSIILAGATPKFVDIETNTLGFDGTLIEAAITSKTQAILVVHLAGVICDIDSIMSIANKYNLLLIEDCAQALGATYNNAQAGSFGDVSCYSFFPTKLITTGEGGMLLTQNKRIAERARIMANHGYGSTTLEREQQSKPWLRHQVLAGFNFRMSNLNAALGVAQMQRIETIVSNRRRLALSIIDQIRGFEGVRTFEFSDRISVYQALNICLDTRVNRDEFTLGLRERGVMASVHYPEVLPLTPVFKEFLQNGDTFSNAKKVADSIVTLPLFSAMTTVQTEYVVAAIHDELNKYH